MPIALVEYVAGDGIWQETGHIIALIYCAWVKTIVSGIAQAMVCAHRMNHMCNLYMGLF